MMMTLFRSGLVPRENDSLASGGGREGVGDENVSDAFPSAKCHTNQPPPPRPRTRCHEAFLPTRHSEKTWTIREIRATWKIVIITKSRSNDHHHHYTLSTDLGKGDRNEA